MHKHFFFDLDDTLTASRSPMASEHVPVFLELCKRYDVAIVTGAQESQMDKQLPKEASGLFYKLSQNGNRAVAKDGSVLWDEQFTHAQEAAINAFIKEVHDRIALSVRDEGNLVEHRGSQISYSLIGHDEDRAIKKAFDPDGSKRKTILAQEAAQVSALRNVGVEVTVAGTTCFDLFLLGKNKGYHVPRLIELEGWTKEDSLYIGDALEPGRNDESVVGVIPTRSVVGPDDTFAFLQEVLS